MVRYFGGPTNCACEHTSFLLEARFGAQANSDSFTAQFVIGYCPINMFYSVVFFC